MLRPVAAIIVPKGSKCIEKLVNNDNLGNKQEQNQQPFNNNIRREIKQYNRIVCLFVCLVS